MQNHSIKTSHHGAVNGVTGSCHELHLNAKNSILIDCGLFQGAETSPNGSNFEQLKIDFPIEQVQAVVVTHCHIDHVGRPPYLLAAGFKRKNLLLRTDRPIAATGFRRCHKNWFY